MNIGKFKILSVLALLFVGGSFYSFKEIDNWLLVDNNVTQANVIVVLGGGGGSRLRKGLELYEQGLSGHLILVDNKASAWQHIIDNLCKDCNLSAKKVDILIGSQSTFSDAELVKEFVLSHNMKSLIVVTDPYHTRRAFLVFNNAFNKQNVSINVVSSGFYGALLVPGKGWWQDQRTYDVVSLEFIKCIYVVAMGLIGYIN